MESPCVNICVLDPDTSLCVGCGRSSDEIGRWTGLTDAGRAEIMAALPARLAALEAAEDAARAARNRKG